MQYTISQLSPPPDVARLQAALNQFDSAARLHFNASHNSLQVVSDLPKDDIVSTLALAGLSIGGSDLVKSSGSDCCGGCGG